MHCFTTKVDSTIIATSARDNTMHSIIPPDIASDEHTDGDTWGKFRHVYWSILLYADFLTLQCIFIPPPKLTALLTALLTESYRAMQLAQFEKEREDQTAPSDTDSRKERMKKLQRLLWYLDPTADNYSEKKQCIESELKPLQRKQSLIGYQLHQVRVEEKAEKKAIRHAADYNRKCAKKVETTKPPKTKPPKSSNTTTKKPSIINPRDHSATGKKAEEQNKVYIKAMSFVGTICTGKNSLYFSTLSLSLSLFLLF